MSTTNLDTDRQSAYTGEEGERYLQQRQRAISDASQQLRAKFFAGFTNDQMTVLDFGCGTGGILNSLPAKQRLGIEIGEAAAEIARKSGVSVFRDLDAIEDDCIDAAISYHAIEHVDSPLVILQQLRRVVRQEGKLRLVVPCEPPFLQMHRVWRTNADRHLYTWTPLLFGNLAERAGMEQINARLEMRPTRSRLVRALRLVPPLQRWVHLYLSLRRNSLNVVLDCSPGHGG